MDILEIFKKTLYNQMQIKFPRVCIMVQIDMNIFDEEHSETPLNKVKHLEIVAGSHA